MQKINFYGQIFGSSGYSAHGRQLVNALHKAGADIKLETSLPQGWELMVNDAELGMINKPPHKDGVIIAVTLPTHWTPILTEPHTKFYGYCVWEGDSIPEAFLPNLHRADGILVPSVHNRDAILNTDPGLVDKVFVVSHGVDTKLFVPQKKVDDKVFEFVVNKGWSQGIYDRGGVQWVLKAFAEEFKKNEPVRLKLKINPAYNRPGWNFQEEINKLGLPSDHAEIMMTDENIAYSGLPKFYVGDVFVSASMAEAFNIPCAEAMACGLPVITTGYGGQIDFVTGANGWLIDYDMVQHSREVLYEGIGWAMPDLDHLKEAMREAFINKGLVRLKAKQALKDVQRLTWDSSARVLLKVIY